MPLLVDETYRSLKRKYPNDGDETFADKKMKALWSFKSLDEYFDFWEMDYADLSIEELISNDVDDRLFYEAIDIYKLRPTVDELNDLLELHQKYNLVYTLLNTYDIVPNKYTVYTALTEANKSHVDFIKKTPQSFSNFSSHVCWQIAVLCRNKYKIEISLTDNDDDEDMGKDYEYEWQKPETHNPVENFDEL